MSSLLYPWVRPERLLQPINPSSVQRAEKELSIARVPLNPSRGPAHEHHTKLEP